MKRFILIVCICLGFYVVSKKFVGHNGASSMRSHADPQGFVGLPIVDKGNKVIIFAPPNCPSADGRRADQLEQLLASAGIPYERTNNIQVEWEGREPSSDELDQSNSIMKGTGPVICIRGKAKNNPTFDEIIAEYRSR